MTWNTVRPRRNASKNHGNETKRHTFIHTIRTNLMDTLFLHKMVLHLDIFTKWNRIEIFAQNIFKSKFFRSTSTFFLLKMQRIELNEVGRDSMQSRKREEENEKERKELRQTNIKDIHSVQTFLGIFKPYYFIFLICFWFGLVQGRGGDMH